MINHMKTILIFHRVYRFVKNETPAHLRDIYNLVTNYSHNTRMI